MDPDAVPVTGDNIVDRAARLLAEHHGVEPHAAVSVAKSIPVAGRHGRRLRRRGRRAGRAGPALGAGDAPTTTCSRWPPSWAATCRSRWSAARRSAPAAASWSSRSRDAGHLVVGRRPLRRGAVHAGGLPPLRRAHARRARGARGRAGGPARRWRRGTPRSWRARCTTTSSPRRSTCDPTWPTCSSWASATARCAGWSPAPGRPACSWPRTPTRPARWPAGCPRTHEVVLVTNGPVAGAHVVTYA